MIVSLDEAIRLYNENQYEDALHALFDLDQAPEENMLIAYYMGLSYTKMENYEEAIKYFLLVLEGESDFIMLYQVRMLVSYIYNITERFRLAELELKHLLDLGFKSPQVCSALSYALFAQEKVDESIEILKEGLDLDPQNPNALNSLGYILADTDIDPVTALRYCRRALDQEPENPAYLDSLGWAYFKAGKIDEAQNYLKRSLEIVGGDKKIAEHLKEVLAARGQ